MRTVSVTKRIAERSGVPETVAGQLVEEVVGELLERLRKGQTAKLPGVGTLKKAGAKVEFQAARTPVRKRGA